MILKSLREGGATSISHTESDASQLLSFDSSITSTRNILGEVEVRAGHQEKLILGTFQDHEKIGGFSLSINPSQDDDSIVAQLTQLRHDDSDLYEFVLHLANYSEVTISVEIRAL